MAADQKVGHSELKYLRLLRDLRDNDPDRFEEIKTLPRKVRTARTVEDETKDPTGLLTFFRRGDLKQIFLADDDTAAELTFFEAAQTFECEPGTPRAEMPDDFYDRLDRNKQAFEYSASEETSEGPSGGFPTRGG